MDIKLEGWTFMPSYMAEAMNARLREIFAGMAENTHFIMKGEKPTLLKAGAEIIMMQMGLTFHSRVLSHRHSTGEFIAETVIYRDGTELGNGLGYAAVSDHGNDGNAALKMAKKRSYIDAVLSVTGASSVFTQDYGESGDPITRNQLSYISSLARGSQIPDDVMDAMLHACGSEKIQEMSKQQASRLIDSMLKYIHSGNNGGNR